jgi:hypothetical protein
MAENHQRPLYVCTCQVCELQPAGTAAELHASINRVLATLNEKSRRRFVGLLATQHGYGGVHHLARVTGLSRTTILRGQREIAQVDANPDGRIRTPGGGRPLLEKNSQRCSLRSRS